MPNLSGVHLLVQKNVCKVSLRATCECVQWVRVLSGESCPGAGGGVESGGTPLSSLPSLSTLRRLLTQPRGAAEFRMLQIITMCKEIS